MCVGTPHWASMLAVLCCQAPRTALMGPRLWRLSVNVWDWTFSMGGMGGRGLSEPLAVCVDLLAELWLFDDLGLFDDLRLLDDLRLRAFEASSALRSSARSAWNLR